MKTLDIDTTDSTLNKKKGGFSGYNFARTSAGFNTGNTGKTAVGTGSNSVNMPNLGLGMTQDKNSMQAM